MNPSSGFQAIARSRLAATASAWRLLTQDQREAWTSLGAGLTRTDSLGQTYTLTGAQAHSLVNANRLVAGDAVVSDCPVLVVPPTVTNLSVSAINLNLSFTPTPLAANQKLFIYVSPARSAGRSFEKDFRLLLVTAAAGAAPVEIDSTYEERFGLVPVGSRIFVRAAVYQAGFVGLPAQATVIYAGA